MYYTTVYDKTYENPLSYIYAKLATIVFVLGTVISMLTYPNYQPSNDYLSDLGTESSSSPWFVATVTITSILLIPSFIAMFRHLHNKVSGIEELLLVFAILTGVTSMVFLFLVGQVPGKGATLDLHNKVAASFFILMATTLSLLSLLLVSSTGKEIINDQRVEDMLGLLFVPMVLVFLDINLWYSKILQKLIVYLGLFYLLYLINRLYENTSERRVFYHIEKFSEVEATSLDQAIILSSITF